MASHHDSNCYHCHLPIPKGFSQSLEIDGKQQYFCCMGCYAVTETILNSGMDGYYNFRQEGAKKIDAVDPNDFEIYNDPDIQAIYINTVPSQASNKALSSTLLFSDYIHCSACSWLIEKRLQQLKTVEKVLVNVSEQTVYIEWDLSQTSLSEIFKALLETGYLAKPIDERNAQESSDKLNKTWLKRIGLAGLGMMQVMMYAVALYIGSFDNMDTIQRDFLRWVSFFVATPVLFYAGFPFFKSSYLVIKQKSLNMDVPIALALILAYSASLWGTLTNSDEVYFDSVTMFVFFLLTSRYIDHRVRYKATHINSKKQGVDMGLIAYRFDSTKAQESQPVHAYKIKVEDQLLIKAGEVINFDSIIVEGESMIDEALVNGEFMPLQKKAGDKLLAGSVNGQGVLRVKVLEKYSHGYINQLQNMQQKALLKKPKASVLADKIAKYFILGILMIAAFTYWYWQSEDPIKALWITVSVLVVSCPCALSLATPIAHTCAVSGLNKRSIYIRSADFLSKLHKVTDIIFDKTGTLTNGQLAVSKVSVLDPAYSEKQILETIAVMESQSSHPIAKAFHTYFPTQENYDITERKEHVFSGVSATINRSNYSFGNTDFISAFAEKDLNGYGDQLLLCKNNTVIAAIELQDTTRSNAADTCERLTQNGFKLHILSGDPSSQVEKLANQLNISSWKNNLKPDDKLEIITSIQKSKRKVLMVGDGLNDAPSMSASDCSMAMQGASDMTKNSADSFLFSGDLTDVQTAIEQSAKATKITKQNLSWALLYNLCMIPFAFLGLLAPYIAAIGMSLSSLLVVINSLRLLKE